MNGYGHQDDDDYITCPDCGVSHYPTIGPPGHMCYAKTKRESMESMDFERSFENGGRRCKIQIEVECYDSHDAITAAIDTAMSDAVLAYGGMRKGKMYSGGDSMFECTYKAIKL